MKTLASKIGILVLASAQTAGADTSIEVQTEVNALHSQYVAFSGDAEHSYPISRTNSIRLLRQGEELAAEKTLIGWLDLPDQHPNLECQALTYVPARAFLSLAAKALSQRSGLENRVPDFR